MAVILTIGPLTVAASMFPIAARTALTSSGEGGSFASVLLLHRICRTYSALGVLVPAFGFATALSMGILTNPWLLMSILLTCAAAAILAGLILPRRRKMLCVL